MREFYAWIAANEKEAFLLSINNQRIPIKYYYISALKIPFSLIEWAIRGVPGSLGIVLRHIYYGLVCKKLGKGVVIDVGVHMTTPHNISIDDYTWIDAFTVISAPGEPYSIGRRIHIGCHSQLAGRAAIVLEDYVGLSSSVRLFSGSETPGAGKRMSGPMVPEQYRKQRVRAVLLKKDAFVGTGSIVLPGITFGEGAVLGANSVAVRNIPAWEIHSGNPAKKIKDRRKVDVPDI